MGENTHDRRPNRDRTTSPTSRAQFAPCKNEIITTVPLSRWGSSFEISKPVYSRTTVARSRGRKGRPPVAARSVRHADQHVEQHRVVQSPVADNLLPGLHSLGFLPGHQVLEDHPKIERDVMADNLPIAMSE